MALAALAILGHKSAHSFPIGPVIAEPTFRSVENKLKTETRVRNQQVKKLTRRPEGKSLKGGALFYQR